MMKKTNELVELEHLISEHLLSELPKDASQVRLKSVCQEFLEFIEQLYIKREAKNKQSSVNTT